MFLTIFFENKNYPRFHKWDFQNVFHNYDQISWSEVEDIHVASEVKNIYVPEELKDCNVTIVFYNKNK